MSILKASLGYSSLQEVMGCHLVRPVCTRECMAQACRASTMLRVSRYNSFVSSVCVCVCVCVCDFVCNSGPELICGSRAWHQVDSAFRVPRCRRHALFSPLWSSLASLYRMYCTIPHQMFLGTRMSWICSAVLQPFTVLLLTLGWLPQQSTSARLNAPWICLPRQASCERWKL